MTKYQDIAMMLEANAITNTVDAYEKGRADKYQEITSEYMLLTEKQVAEIGADAIDDFLDWLLIDHYVRDAHMWDMEKEEILKEFKRQKNE